MRVRDLGSLVIEVAGQQHGFGSTRQGRMLAYLVMQSNHRVSCDELVEAVWGVGAEVSTSSVDNQVWRLRKLLEPERIARETSSCLVNEAGGFRLIIPAGGVDSIMFEGLVSVSRTALAEGRPGEAVSLCDDALRLWRGRPYEAIAELPATAATVARLEELRDQVLERRIDALMASGEIERSVAESGDLVRRMPLREPAWARRMEALALAGRTEEALATYQSARSTLLAEVGLEPGPELRALQERVLRGDTPPMLRIRGADADQPVSAAEPRLPGRTTGLVGRDRELAFLEPLLLEHPLVTLAGPGGSGKTRLAVELGYRLASTFPDGVFFVDLNAVTDASLVVEAFTSTIGLEGDASSSAIETLSSYASRRRLLLIMDNCEHVLEAAAEVAESLVGPERSVAMLTTSREPLGVSGEQIWSLSPLALDEVLDPRTGQVLASPAVQLFLERVRATAPTLALDESATNVVVSICRGLDGLPLAIELAAARSRSFTLVEIADQVLHNPGRLSRLGRGADDHRRTLHETIEWSHRLLPPAEQALHRRISVLPGQFTRHAARALAEQPPLEAEDTDDLLAMLVHRSMLGMTAPATAGRGTTYAQLATVRSHAAATLTAAGETDKTLHGRDAWVDSLLAARPLLGRPEEAVWYDRIEDDYFAIRAALDRPLDVDVIRRGAGLSHFWYYRSRVVEGCRWLEKAVTASPATESAEGATVRVGLVAALFLCGRTEEAKAAHASLEDLPIPSGHSREFGEALAGAAKAAWSRNEFDIGRRLHRRLAALSKDLEDPNLELITDAVGCAMRLPNPDLMETAARAESVYERAQAAGNLEAQWVTAAVRQFIALVQGDPAAGLLWNDRLISSHISLGTGGTGIHLEGRANLTAMQGDSHAALRLYAAAKTQTERVGMVWPRQPITTDLLVRARAAVGDSASERVWQEGRHLTVEDVARDAGLI